MSVTYLTTPIVEARRDYPPRGSGMSRDGYTKRSGAPSSLMIRLQGEKRWRRLMVWQFSNMGTSFVNLAGVPHVVREEMLPAIQEEGAVGVAKSTTRHHATMKAKSGTQLNREIAEALGRSHSTKKRKEPRVVQVEAKTSAGYRWLLSNARGADKTPKGFVVTNEHDWAQSLAAAGAVEIK